MGQPGTPDPHLHGEHSIGAVVEDTIERVRPTELPLVRRYRSNDHAFVLRSLKKRGRDDPLGFGLTDAVVHVAPILYIALDQALRKVVDVPVESAVKRIGGRLFGRRRRNGEAVPAMDAAGIRQVCDAVELSLMRDAVPPPRAREVVEALERRLRERSGLAAVAEQGGEDDGGTD